MRFVHSILIPRISTRQYIQLCRAPMVNRTSRLRENPLSNIHTSATPTIHIQRIFWRTLHLIGRCNSMVRLVTEIGGAEELYLGVRRHFPAIPTSWGTSSKLCISDRVYRHRLCTSSSNFSPVSVLWDATNYNFAL
jgi:hypothetical protein